MAIAAIIVAFLAGSEINAGTIVSVIVGAITAGLGIAGGPSPRGGAGAGLILLAFALGSSGCGACVAERAVVSSLDAGLTAAEVSVGDEATESFGHAIHGARGATLLGAAAVEACELARDGAGWQAWVGLALEAAAGVAAHFGGADGEGTPAEPPTELVDAIAALEAEAQ